MSLAAKEAETRIKDEDPDADADADADADTDINVDADADADGEEDMHVKTEDDEMTPSLKAEEDDNDSVVHSMKGEDGIVVPKLKRSASSLDEDAKLAAELDARLAAELHAQWNGGRPSRRGKQVPKTTPKKKGRKKSDELVNPESRKPEKKKRKVNPNSPFNAPLILSEPLSNLLGEAQLSRPETVKRIWQYVKERNLQDPDDRRYILCDDSMKPIFGNKIHMLYVFLCLPPGGVSLTSVLQHHEQGPRAEHVQAGRESIG